MHLPRLLLLYIASNSNGKVYDEKLVTALAKILSRMTLLRLLTESHGRISSVGRALDRRAGGRGFDSRGRTNTQGLKITEK